MTTSFNKFAIMSAILLMISSISFAGGMESGGGNAVVCRNTHGQMISAEIYDLFEGRALYGYIPKLSISSYRDQALDIAKRVSESSGNSFFIDETERILAEVRFLPPDASLNPINDTGSIIKPANCELYQIATYQSNKRVYFDSTVWNLLDETNRAALISHEVIYALLRNSGNTTSARARQYVSYLYSGQTLHPIWSPDIVNQEPFEVCQTTHSKLNTPNTPWTAFKTRLNPDGTWKISFTSFDGNFVFGKTEINATPTGNYVWPVATHWTSNGQPGGGGEVLKGKLTFDVDEGWDVEMFILDLDSDEHLLILKNTGVSKWIYFRCNVFNLSR